MEVRKAEMAEHFRESVCEAEPKRWLASVVSGRVRVFSEKGRLRASTCFEQILCVGGILRIELDL